MPSNPLLLVIPALAVVLGLVVLAGRFARAGGWARATQGGRLVLVQALPLDQRRRLHLVRCDRRHVLLLTGGGSDVVVGWLDEPGFPDPATVPETGP